MQELKTRDGRYWAVDQDDENFVVYDMESGEPVPAWDRWSYEALNPKSQIPNPPIPADPVPVLSQGFRAIKVTNELDGDLLNRGYSYWPSSWVSGASVYAFVGHADGQPRFYLIDVPTGTVTRLGPLLGYDGTGEGWYFDSDGYVYLCDGPRLRRVNPFVGDDRVVFDISSEHPNCRLWQAHSSDDGQTHCATVQQIVSDGPYPNLGTVVFRKGRQEYYPAQGTLDESAITSDGAYLVIKEGNDNRVITLGSRETRWLRDADGAVGHSDCGPSLMVGEDDQHGECVLWDLRKPLVPEHRRRLFSTWNMGHVSVRGGKCLLSNDDHLSLVHLDGGGVTPLLEHGMKGSGYDFQVQGTLDPTGRVATYVSNAAGRMDLYLVWLP